MTLREIIAEPLVEAEFAPFGQVVETPDAPGREFFSAELENARPDAHVDLSVATLEPLVELPLTITLMERHPYSSQTFLPLGASRYFVIVAPDAPDGGPDMGAVRAFIADGRQGVTYRRGTWHHGMTVLDTIARMAVLMWRDGSRDDQELVDIEQPVRVMLPGAGIKGGTK
jgi:ureidoglycolate lyase